MRAAEQGASFALAKHVRESMTPSQLHDFAKTKSQKLPAHADKHPHRNLGAYLHPKKGR